MSTKKLFVATGIFHPEPGGPATYLKEILPHFSELGWDIRLLSYGDAQKNTYPYAVTRIPRQFFPIRLMKYASAARPLLNWADVVYTHTIDLPLWGSRRAPRILKIVGDQAWERCIRRGWVPQDTHVDDFQVQDFGLRVQWQKQTRANQVRNSDAVIVPSNYLKRMVTGWGVPSDRVKVIYNALPLADNVPDMPANEARHHLSLPDAPLLLTAARLHPWKGIDHTITALKGLPDIHLIVAGDGPDRSRLEKLAEPLSDRIHFLGQIPREKLLLYMRAADYTVLYSGYEGLSHTLLESLQMGTPVIVSDKGGNPETVTHDVNGLIIPYVDIEALRATLRDAIEPATRGRLAANHTHEMDRFTFNTMLHQTHEFLSSFA